jgi:hypothetical protein
MPTSPTHEPANEVQLIPPFGQSPNRLHDTPTAAVLIGIAPASLELDRSRRRLGISHYKIGRVARYRESDLLAFLERCRVEG